MKQIKKKKKKDGETIDGVDLSSGLQTEVYVWTPPEKTDTFQNVN